MEGLLKSAGKPRIGNIARRIGKIEQLMDFPVTVLAEHPPDIAQIETVHADDIIVLTVIGFFELHGKMRFAGNAVAIECIKCRRIDRIAAVTPYFLRAGRTGSDHEIIRNAAPPHHILQDHLCHRRAADIAVADKHYFYHGLKPP